MIPVLIDIPDTTASFSPTSIADLALWLDASDASSLTLDGSNNVSQWNDKSGNGKNAAQATSTKRPSAVTKTINSLVALDWDGTDDCLQVSSLSLTPSQTLFIVYKQDISNSKPIFIEHGADANSNDGFFFYGFSPSCLVHRSPNTNSNTDSALALYGTDARLVTYLTDTTLSATGVIHRLRKNLSDLAMSASGTNSGTTVTNSSLSATLNIGSRNNGAAVPFDGSIGELLIYSRALNTTERDNVETYLKAKWGTP